MQNDSESTPKPQNPTPTKDTDISAEPASTPDTNSESKEKKAKNGPLPAIKMPPKSPDQGGKTWADIMNEMTALPTSQQIDWGIDTMKILREKAAQQELYAAAKKDIINRDKKPPIEGPPIEGAPKTLEDLEKEWGPNGSLIENAGEKNRQRIQAEQTWRKDKELLKAQVTQELIAAEKKNR